MPPHDEEAVNERSQLLSPRVTELSGRRGSRRDSHLHLNDAESIISSHLSKEEEALGSTAVGERLPYNEYTSIDWLHDLVSTLSSLSEPTLTLSRSKTPFVTAQFSLDEESRAEHSRSGMHLKGGLQQQ